MKIENFAILKGENTQIKDGVIKYLPEWTGEDEKKVPLSADIRSDKSFFQGVLEFKFKSKKNDAGILLLLEDNGKFISSIGLSKMSNSFEIDDRLSGTLIQAGKLKNYKPNSEIHVKIDWRGSNCQLLVNNVIICEAKNFLPKSMPVYFRITSSDTVTVYDIKITEVKPRLFVVMQFSEKYNKLYNEVINPISEELGFECIRADEFHTSTPILKDIINSIVESTAIVAEITPDNPNVFYEIGYAHAINKPTILLCDNKREKLPFDISGFRTLFYEDSISGKSKIENSLRKYLENIKK